MSTIKYTNSELEYINFILNCGKEVFIEKLIKDKFISESDGKIIKEHYIINAFKKGMIGKTIDKLIFNNENEDNVIVIVVKR